MFYSMFTCLCLQASGLNMGSTLTDPKAKSILLCLWFIGLGLGCDNKIWIGLN